MIASLLKQLEKSQFSQQLDKVNKYFTCNVSQVAGGGSQKGH